MSNPIVNIVFIIWVAISVVILALKFVCALNLQKVLNVDIEDVSDSKFLLLFPLSIHMFVYAIMKKRNIHMFWIVLCLALISLISLPVMLISSIVIVVLLVIHLFCLGVTSLFRGINK